MTFHKIHIPFLLCLLVMLAGCTMRSAPKPIVDPLVERNQQWRAHVEEGNAELRRGNLRDALVAYQAAVAIRPDAGGPRLKIAELYFQLEEYENARDAFVAFLVLEPKNVNALNYAGYISEKLNDYQSAAKHYEKVLTVSKDNLYALNHLGLAYKQLGRLDEAVTVLREALSLDAKCERPESENLHNYLGLIYLEQGKVGEAIAEWRESIRLFPKAVWARQQLAALYEDRGRYYEAQLQYQELLEVAPDNLLAVTRLQALARLQSAPTRGGVNVPPTGEGVNVSPVGQGVYVSPVDLLQVDADLRIANAPDADAYPDADALILFNHFSHDVLPTGQSRYTTHQAVKLLTERGIEKYDDIAIPFQPSAQNITVNIARTIAADGTVYQPPQEAFNDVTPPGLLSQNLYSDTMWRVISMVGLTPGVCIEYQVTLEDKPENAVGGETWITGGFNFQSTEVTLETNYALRIPSAWHLQWKTENFSRRDLPVSIHQEKPQVSTRYDENGNVIYVWHYGETPALAVEEGMPHVNDIAPRLHYSSIPSWNDVYLWYQQLAADRYTPDAQIEARVYQLTKDLTTKADKIRAIYHFVASRIRYVGIELGQSAYQPSPATEVLQKQYGDCKDKTTLLIAMLELVGIRAYPVLINPSPYERTDTELPSLNQFSHMLAAIPSNDGIARSQGAPIGVDEAGGYIWLDATSSTCSYGNLPYSDQGRKGFLIGEAQGEFVDIPIFPAETNRLVSTTELWLSEEGSVQGKIHIQTRGQYAINARWTYQQVPPSQLQTTLATELSQQFPGIAVEWSNISDLANLNVPVEMELGFQVQNYATLLEKEHPGRSDRYDRRGFKPRLRGEKENLGRSDLPVAKENLGRSNRPGVDVAMAMLLPMPIDEFAEYAVLVAAPQRAYSLDLGYPTQLEKEIQIHLPEGWTAVLPADIQHTTDFAELSRQYRQTESTVTYRLTFTLKERIIPAAAYASAKRLFTQLASEDGSRLLLQSRTARDRPPR